MADTLVLAGIPFRRAHHLVGQAEAIAALPPLTPLYLLEQTTTEGGPGPAAALAVAASLRGRFL